VGLSRLVLAPSLSVEIAASLFARDQERPDGGANPGGLRGDGAAIARKLLN
jgi:hypothetical protein